mmetsp:Transcript_8039/g.17286  ORF Transcript_8039/g.17286 Transcript_8039/m.17286 type:complete len:143 (+) Transcript_8039:40-468(+)
MVSAFVGGSAQRLSSRTPARGRSAVCGLRMSDDAAGVVAEKYPIYVKNKAPFIVFDPIDGEQGVKLEMVEVPAFATSDDSAGTLFDYDDGKFKPSPPPNMGIAWPSGDGRGTKMTGTKGYYSQPNLKEYGPFPDFFKRSCDG